MLFLKMVDSDIQQAQETLQSQQAEASRLIEQRIPQRRFGASVTSAQQQLVIEQRKQARVSLRDIKTRRKELLDIQKQRDQARSVRQSALAARRETLRLIRIAKVERKIALRRLSEREVRAIRSVEEQLKQSLPLATRQKILEQIRRGEKVIDIPTIEELSFTPIPELSFTSISEGVSIPTEGFGIFAPTPPPATRLESIQRRISEERFRGGIPAALAGVIKPFISTAQFGRALITTPITTTKETGRAIGSGFRKAFITQEGFPEIGRVLRFEPEFATGAIAGEIALFRVGQIAVIKGKPIVTKVVTPLRPSFRPLEGEVGRRRVTIPFEGGELDVGFVERGGGFGIPLSEQLEFAGRRGVTVGTAQRGLFPRFAKSVEIEKPLLPGAPPLERSLFVSPPGRRGVPVVRISRLGLEPQKPATLLDILGGDITFRSPQRAQAIILRADIEAIPPGLKGLARRASRAGVGSPEAIELSRRLLKFQLTPTGKLKPGFLTGEAEFTLSPGEVLERKRRLGVTLIERRPVELIEAEIRVPKLRTSTRKERLRRQEISDIKLADIGRETGIDFSSEALGRRGTISPSAATTFSLRVPSVRKIAARRVAKVSPLVRVPDIKISARPLLPTRVVPRIRRVGRGTKATRAIISRPLIRIATVRTAISPPTIKPPPGVFPIFKFDGLTKRTFGRRKKKDDFLFFSQGFTGKLLGKVEKGTIKQFRERALKTSLADIRGRPIVIRKRKLKGKKKK